MRRAGEIRPLLTVQTILRSDPGAKGLEIQHCVPTPWVSRYTHILEVYPLHGHDLGPPLQPTNKVPEKHA